MAAMACDIESSYPKPGGLHVVQLQPRVRAVGELREGRGAEAQHEAEAHGTQNWCKGRQVQVPVLHFTAETKEKKIKKGPKVRAKGQRSSSHERISPKNNRQIVFSKMTSFFLKIWLFQDILLHSAADVWFKESGRSADSVHTGLQAPLKASFPHRGTSCFLLWCVCVLGLWCKKKEKLLGVNLNLLLYRIKTSSKSWLAVQLMANNNIKIFPFLSSLLLSSSFLFSPLLSSAFLSSSLLFFPFLSFPLLSSSFLYSLRHSPLLLSSLLPPLTLTDRTDYIVHL